MNDMLTLVLSIIAGGGLGAIFFGGLWWTIGKGLASERPAFWFISSMLLRTGIALTGFYFVSGGQWQRLMLCLAGFLVARPVVTWLTRPAKEILPGLVPEVDHAPHS